jgi:peptidoglycan/LPS O-acetylase OafA/YrhL
MPRDRPRHPRRRRRRLDFRGDVPMNARGMKAAQRYMPGLDGLRLVCCVAVIANHAFVLTPLQSVGPNLGELGVHTFFVLSGFLITKLLLVEADGSGRIDLRAFYVRRTLRIWPVYYAALLVGFTLPYLGAAVRSAVGYSPSPELLTRALPLHVLFLVNWTESAVPTPLQVLWSISVEEQFYLLFPVLLVLARRWSPRRPVFVVAIPLLLAVWAARASVAFPAPPLAWRRHTWVVSDFLLFGALLAQLQHLEPAAAARLARKMRWWAEPLLILAFIVLATWDHWNPSRPTLLPWVWIGYNAASAFAMAALIGLLAFGSPAEGLTRWLAQPYVANPGRVTYAGYVFHMYALVVAWAVVARVLPGSTVWTALGRLLLATPLTFVLAYASKYLLENRFARLKTGFERVRTESPAPSGGG